MALKLAIHGKKHLISKVKNFGLACFSLGTTRKKDCHHSCVTLAPIVPVIWYRTRLWRIIPDDNRVISQKHNTNLYWLLSLGCDTLDEPNSAALPFCLARTRPGAVHCTFMLQPFWAIWVEKMGFYASRIAVTLFLTLWICRTQGQHGGMESQGKLRSPIFSNLRFSSNAFSAVTDDSGKRFFPQYITHTPACTFQKSSTREAFS